MLFRHATSNPIQKQRSRKKNYPRVVGLDFVCVRGVFFLCGGVCVFFVLLFVIIFAVVVLFVYLFWFVMFRSF